MATTNGFNFDQLETYLKSYTEIDGPLNIEKFKGGQSNPTFKLTDSNGSYVLRAQPIGKLLKSAHAVDREFKVQEALYSTAVPVAKMLHLCTDREIIGSMFYLMEFKQGNIYWDASLPEIPSPQRPAYYQAMIVNLAKLHQVDIDQQGLAEYGKPGNYFARQLARWSSQYQASETRNIQAMDRLINWLEQQLPEDDGQVSLVHGDYRLDNLMFHSEKAEIVATLDWELSTLGHPWADLAYQCMCLRMPAAAGGMSGLLGKNRADLQIPTEAEYIASYCQQMQLSQQRISNWSFYLAFSYFRLAAICQGVAKRAELGNASNSQASKIGAMVEPLANFALQVIEEDP